MSDFSHLAVYLSSDLFVFICAVCGVNKFLCDVYDLLIYRLKDIKPPSGIKTVVKNPQFEEGLSGWSGRGCKICRHELTAYGNVKPVNGSYFASATGRVNNWNGIQQDITGRVQRKISYEISSHVRIFGSANETEVRATLWVQEYGRERYVCISK